MISAPTENERTATGMAEYIEREALRDALYDADAITMNGVKILNQFPPSDVEPVKHGRWERDEWGSYLRRCSVCKKSPVYKDERGNSIAVYADVCINCGAKMDGNLNG